MGKKTTLSGSQVRYLRALLDGTSVTAHCRTMQDYGGVASTEASLLRRGLVRYDRSAHDARTNSSLVLTEAGREYLGG